VAGWGLIEWTRLEAEKVTADQIGNRKRTEPPSVTKGGIRMKSPADASTAYGMTGTQYNTDAEGIFIVSAGIAGGRLRRFHKNQLTCRYVGVVVSFGVATWPIDQAIIRGVAGPRKL
jgi:hypothetical protein